MATRFHYPHVTTVLLTYLVVGVLFVMIGPSAIHSFLEPWGIGGIFIAGMMYTVSLTAAIAAFVLPTFAFDYSPGTIAIIGGLGSTLVDLTILRFIRSDLKAEMKKLSNLPILKTLGQTFPLTKKKWARTVLGYLVLALPIPDEVGIALMSHTKISEERFRIIGFIVNTIGIYALVSIVGPLY